MDTYPETSFTLPDMPATIKWLRKMRKMKLHQAATAAGLSVSFLSDIERGRTPPSLGTLKKLALAYNAPLVLHIIV